MAEIGDRIRQLRKRAGITQQKLAEEMRVPLETIRNWEQGKREPRAAALQWIEVSLDMIADDYQV